MGRPSPDANRQGVRCSNKGFLPMSTAESLTLRDWTARQQRADKPGVTPKQVGRLFERLGISAEAWKELGKNFGRMFSVVAGKPSPVDGHSSRSGSLQNSHGGSRSAPHGFSTLIHSCEAGSPF